MNTIEAKSFNKRLKLPKNWNNIKLYEMLTNLKKFQHKNLSQMLIDTNDTILTKINYWYNNYWSIKSQDKIGQII